MPDEIKVPVGTARAEFADLLDRCKRCGESFVITRHGRPVAKLVPVEGQKRETRPGDPSRDPRFWPVDVG